MPTSLRPDESNKVSRGRLGQLSGVVSPRQLLSSFSVAYSVPLRFPSNLLVRSLALPSSTSEDAEEQLCLFEQIKQQHKKKGRLLIVHKTSTAIANKLDREPSLPNAISRSGEMHARKDTR